MTVQSEELETWKRPSNLDKLDLCIHHRPDGLAGQSPYVQRGNKIDPWVRKLINGQGIGSWKIEESGDVAAAQWVAEQALKLLTKIECQKKLELWDFFSAPVGLIMRGTADICGLNKEDGILEVWDVKSGRQREYSAQLMVYALMLMDETQRVECCIRVAYCDLKVFQQTIVTRQDCEEKVFGILERIRIGVEPPQENEYCQQCARMSVCEVWTIPAYEALSVMNADDPLHDLPSKTARPDLYSVMEPALSVQSRLEIIKKDPALLGRFIDAWRKANTLVEKAGIEDHAKELLISGKEVPGWRAVEYQGRAFYNKEQIEKILAEWGETAADFLAVNRERYEGACKNSDNDYLEPEGRSKSFYKLLRSKNS